MFNSLAKCSLRIFKRNHGNNARKIFVSRKETPCYYPTVLVQVVNMSYYLAFIPFGIGFCKEDKKYYIKTNRLQQIFCILQQTLAIVGIVWMCSRNFQDNLTADPSLFYHIFNNYGIAFQFSLFLSFSWSKKENVINIVNIPTYKESTTPPKSFGLTYIWIGFEFMATLLLFQAENCVGLFYDQEISTRTFLHATYQSKSGSKGESISSMMSQITRTVVLWIYGSYMYISVSHWFTVCGILTIYEIINKCKPSDSTSNTSRPTINNFIDAKYMVATVNSCFGNIFLAEFVKTFLEAAFQLFYMLDGSSALTKRLVRVVYIAPFFATLWLAAKCDSNMRKFKDLHMDELSGEVVDIETGTSARHACMYLPTDYFHSGVRAGDFFTVTFGFLGTVLSVMLTYLLVMIQFMAQSPLPESNQNCSCNAME